MTPLETASETADHEPQIYPWKAAPAHLKTRRQFRAAGLAPGGHAPVAQTETRRRGRRLLAYLYDVRLTVPKRTASPAQLAAVAKAVVFHGQDHLLQPGIDQEERPPHLGPAAFDDGGNQHRSSDEIDRGRCPVAAGLRVVVPSGGSAIESRGPGAGERIPARLAIVRPQFRGHLIQADWPQSLCLDVVDHERPSHRVSTSHHVQLPCLFGQRLCRNRMPNPPDTVGALTSDKRGVSAVRGPGSNRAENNEVAWTSSFPELADTTHRACGDCNTHRRMYCLVRGSRASRHARFSIFRMS
ncbi:RRQRL motif-containing zinc-binding protein [Nocardia cerradoensis]|uniref:Uncharacterized protein n=1 Tax=Nocardia cerradoensis TaxID=85688 RepID=A0A231GT65_9NOCA|nr:RRQRL motif-containing zinc-binding protein [Nocardia cerradoensis]OXR39809.1 hypothetical protein B7C42_08121 [Nocardia cerradoensis]